MKRASLYIIYLQLFLLFTPFILVNIFIIFIIFILFILFIYFLNHIEIRCIFCQIIAELIFLTNANPVKVQTCKISVSSCVPQGSHLGHFYLKILTAWCLKYSNTLRHVIAFIHRIIVTCIKRMPVHQIIAMFCNEICKCDQHSSFFHFVIHHKLQKQNTPENEFAAL